MTHLEMFEHCIIGVWADVLLQFPVLSTNMSLKKKIVHYWGMRVHLLSLHILLFIITGVMPCAQFQNMRSVDLGKNVLLF